MVQAHPLSALGALGDLRCQIPSKNMTSLGAFVGPDAGDLDKFLLSRYSNTPPSPPIYLLRYNNILVVLWFTCIGHTTGQP